MALRKGPAGPGLVAWIALGALVVGSVLWLASRVASGRQLVAALIFVGWLSMACLLAEGLAIYTVFRGDDVSILGCVFVGYIALYGGLLFVAFVVVARALLAQDPAPPRTEQPEGATPSSDATRDG